MPWTYQPEGGLRPVEVDEGTQDVEGVPLHIILVRVRGTAYTVADTATSVL